MTCYHPLSAFQLSNQKTINNKKSIVFKKPTDQAFTDIKLACGQCIGCRIARSRSWAIRCVHEASLYSNNCFITLTFNDQFINKNHELVKSDFQNFMKRLRDKYCGIQEVNGKYPIRYFHCGEYGSDLMRPHHHAALFNFDFADKELWQVRDGVRLYRSKSLEELWPFGFSTIGDLTYQSAAYIARYCMKKINGKMSQVHYVRVDETTGEILKDIQPEYITMSRRPGIARLWYEKFKNDLYPKDFVTHQGKKHMIPKYYDKIYDVEYPESMKKIKKIRLTKAKENADNNISERLRIRKAIAEAKCKQLIRNYEREKTCS